MHQENIRNLKTTLNLFIQKIFFFKNYFGKFRKKNRQKDKKERIKYNKIKKIRKKEKENQERIKKNMKKDKDKKRQCRKI